MNYCILNGKKSTLIKGLMIQSLPPISKPLMRSRKEEIDGRDGDIITKLGYSAYDKQMSIGLFGDFDIDEVIQFFDSEGTVIFSNEPDKFYKYTIINQIDFERLIRFRTATVTFHVQPFKYSAVDDSFDFDINLIKFKGFNQTTNNVNCKVTREHYLTPPANVISDSLHIRLNGIPSVLTEFYIPIQEIQPIMHPMSSELTLKASWDTDYFPYFDNTIAVRLIRNNPTDADSFGFDKLELAYDSYQLQGDVLGGYKYIWIQLKPSNRYKMDLWLTLDNPQLTSFDVFNKGNIESKPKITIWGENDIDLNLNGAKIFDIALASDKYITIDASEMNAYKRDTLKNRSVVGDYNNLRLSSGRNEISWTGTVKKITMENVSRWI
jgi:predicted phage tail component-like protein